MPLESPIGIMMILTSLIMPRRRMLILLLMIDTMTTLRITARKTLKGKISFEIGSEEIV